MPPAAKKKWIPRPTSPDQFFEQAYKPALEACWTWNGRKARHGYGQVYHSGHWIGAHRFAWMVTYGEPGSLFVCHACDNPSCVNPTHLFLGTHQDNMDDREAKGRHNGIRGETCPWTRLSDEQVAQIRERFGPYRGRYTRGLESSIALAKEFGVRSQYIQKIARGQRRAG